MNSKPILLYVREYNENKVNASAGTQMLLCSYDREQNAMFLLTDCDGYEFEMLRWNAAVLVDCHDNKVYFEEISKISQKNVDSVSDLAVYCETTERGNEIGFVLTSDLNAFAQL